METKNVFISTSIPYVNARPHIGHALEFVQTDAYARYRRLMGDNVFFTSGTDDNALKNVLKAEEAGEEVSHYVRRHADIFKETCEDLNISYDYFIETSNDAKHVPGAQKLWQAADARGDIYKREYEGPYCVGCEEFKTEKDVNENGECPEHPGKKLEVVKESNYFFKLTNYQDSLVELIESDELKITPSSRKNEILSFIKGGLQDFSISRSVERARGWGVRVPGDDSQVMYVWFDALANYITALDYADEGENFQKFWLKASKRLHFIGKGINRFHTVYWPAMLLSAGLPLPTEVFVHGYFTVDGQKMSKSIGNVIDPKDLVDRYGADAVRYYFLRHQHPIEDGDFTIEKFEEAYTANLVNGLGNLTARVMKMSETHLEPEDFPPLDPATLDAPDMFNFQQAMDHVWSLIQRADEAITETEPFKLIKTDPDQAKAILSNLRADLLHIGRLLLPAMPETSEKIRAAVRANKKPDNLFNRLPE